MAKVSVILVLVGLTVMASAYSFRPLHNEGVQAVKQGVIAQLKEHANKLAEIDEFVCPPGLTECGGKCCFTDECVPYEEDICLFVCLDIYESVQ